MHSGDLAELSSANLTGTEREALLQVMQRAKLVEMNFSTAVRQNLKQKQFDQQNALSGPLEGQLYKWTNPLKGWQPRWFNVDQQQGVLHYYTSEERRKHPPRGSLHLWGAVIAPSEEDSQTFSVNGANGEIYKLRAVDAKERQYWVSRLRREVEHCTNQSFGTPVKETLKLPSTSSAPSTPQSSRGGAGDKGELSPSTTPQSTTPTRTLSKRLREQISKSKLRVRGPGAERGKLSSHDHSHDQDDSAQLPGGDAMLEVLTRLQCYQESLATQLESGSDKTGLEPTDKSVLILKATAQAAVHSVKDCLALMKVQQTQGSSEQYLRAVSVTSSTAVPVSSPNDAAAVDKRLKMPRPLSTSNIDEQLIDLSPESHSQTEGGMRTKRAMTATTV